MTRKHVQIQTLATAGTGAEKSPAFCFFIIYTPDILMAIADKQLISIPASLATVASL